jgi:magnesium transporter
MSVAEVRPPPRDPEESMPDKKVNAPSVLPRLRRGTSTLLGRFRKHHPEAGSRPGTLVIPEGAEPPRLCVLEYSESGISERDIADIGELSATLPVGTKRWLDVRGLGDEAVLRGIGQAFAFHPLLLEDVVNVPQPPKSELYERHHFLVTRMFRLRDGVEVDSEQVTIVLSRDTVITFQERVGDVLDPVRRRLRDGLGPMRASGPDYLAYAILDTVVDHYYAVIEMLGERLEVLEEELMLRADDEMMRRMLRVKGDLLGFRRALRPQRDALTLLLRDGSPYVDASVLPYFRDTLDHATQAVEVVDTYRELVTGMMNTHLSVAANRTNEVMKVLTIMASIFIPLTFLAGIYGMNFDHMPELHQRWAYPALLAIMGLAAAGMLYFFRRKGWLGSKDGSDKRG